MTFTYRVKHRFSQDAQSLHLPKDGTPRFWAKGPAFESLSFVAIRKRGWGSVCITWPPPCVNSPHQQQAPRSLLHGLVLYTGTSSHAQPVPRAPDKARAAPRALLFPGRASHRRPRPDKSVPGAGSCLRWGFQTHYSKGRRGLAPGRANSGLKE